MQAATTERRGDSPSSWVTIAQLQARFGIGRTAAYAWAHCLPSDA
jgi:hypothetical protein